MVDAVNKLHKEKPFKYIQYEFCCSNKLGIVDDNKIIDLCYEEDSNAKVDMNIVGTEDGEFVEVQGTGEKSPMTREELNKLLDLGEKGLKQMIAIQKNALKMDALWIGTGGR